jgi:hypothetical protein
MTMDEQYEYREGRPCIDDLLTTKQVISTEKRAEPRNSQKFH